MKNIYFTANVLYLPINPQEFGKIKFYICVDVSGYVYPNDLHTVESLDERVAAGDLKKADKIFPHEKDGDWKYKCLR